MPFIVERSNACPASRPYGVFTETAHGSGKSKGRPHGCFSSAKAAREQQKALYANVPEANAQVRPDQVCDFYSPEPADEEATSAGTPEVPMSATASPVSMPQTPEWRRDRALALSESQRKRPESRQVHEPLELREATEDGTRTLRSYASLFDSPYSVRAAGYRFDEIVRPGAFKRTLGRNPDVVFRTEHSGPPLAATWSGDLRLGEDARGLWYEVDLDESDPDVQALISKVKRGVYRESSFAFRIPKDGDKWNDEHDEREIFACELDRGDVSVVTFGASRETGKHMVLRSEEALLALQEVGRQQFIAAWKEYREWITLPAEERLGKVISSQSAETLRRVLGLIADADDAVDEAEAMLAEFLGEANPDNAEDVEKDGGSVTDAEQLGKLGRSEERDDPSYEDYDVMYGLKNVKLALASVKACQLCDPGNGTDPDDNAVMAAIEAADADIDAAIVAQAQDGRRDPDESNTEVQDFWKRCEEIASQVGLELHWLARADEPLGFEILRPPRQEEPREDFWTVIKDLAEQAQWIIREDDGGVIYFQYDGEEGEDEYWLSEEEDLPEDQRADLSDSGREAMAKQGTAMPDGSYPIPNVAYLKKAIRAFGRAKDKSAVKSWIKRRAKALGATSLLPASWRTTAAPIVVLVENDTDDLQLQYDARVKLRRA